jgi:hypothetical protein
MGEDTNEFFKELKAKVHSSLKSKGTSLTNNLVRGLAILLKSLMNLLKKPA